MINLVLYIVINYSTLPMFKHYLSLLFILVCLSQYYAGSGNGRFGCNYGNCYANDRNCRSYGDRGYSNSFSDEFLRKKSLDQGHILGAGCGAEGGHVCGSGSRFAGENCYGDRNNCYNNAAGTSSSASGGSNSNGLGRSHVSYCDYPSAC